jgi:hypothetical protein
MNLLIQEHKYKTSVTNQAFNTTLTRSSPQYIHWPEPEIVDPTLRAFLLAKAYSNFYPVEGHQPSQMSMSAAIVSMLNNILDPNHISGAGAIGASMQLARIYLVVVTYDNNSAQQLAQDGRW